jgi:hypothetical protein
MHPIESLARDKDSPYWDDGQPVRMRTSVVVFADILGFTEKTRRANDLASAQELLRHLRSTLNGALMSITQDWMKLSGGMARRPWEYKAFTDNVVIGFPIRDSGEVELGRVFSNLSMFQLKMAQAGRFIRGSIAVGDLYIDRDIVFGAGLLEAYDVEQKLARDPRIVLAPSAVRYLTQHLARHEDPHGAPHNRDLLVDADGQTFLNYLDSILIAESEHGPFYDELLGHKDQVTQALQAHRGDPKVWSKYEWVAKYHNYFCSMHSYFDDEHRIELEALAPTMRALVE